MIEAPVFVVLHTADLFHDPRMFAPTLRDWSKIRAYRAGKWPRKLPDAHVVAEGYPDPDVPALMVEAWKAPFLAIDTEYSAPPGKKWEDIRRSDAILNLVGVGWAAEAGDRVLQCPWGPLNPTRTGFSAWLHGLVRAVPVVFQNANADIPLLAAYLGIEYSDYCRVEDLMLAHATLWSEWPHDLEFLASVYSLYPKTKHMRTVDPLLYNRGDVADTVQSWIGIQPELEADPQSRAIYENQSLPLVPILLRRQEVGIKTNQPKIAEASAALKAEMESATRLARAYTGVADFNLGSPAQLQRWLYDIEGLAVQKNKKTRQRTIDDEALVVLREKFDPIPDFEEEQVEPLTYDRAVVRSGDGAHSVLEARIVYAAAQQALAHYLRPMLGRSRIYPSFAIHAQASGRWSITGPPLQQFPRVPKGAGPGHIAQLIQDSIEPDEGEVWFGWDWKSIEPRLEAYQSGEPKLIEMFETGQDQYVLWANLMGWATPTDMQRQLAKRFKLKLSYGGSEKSELPGASKLGLSREDIAKAGTQALAGLPRLAAYWKRLQAQALHTRQIRTFDGRLRRLLGKTAKAMREAMNHPNQGGVSGILNRTIIEIHAALPYALVVFTVHDAGWIGLPRAKYDEARPVIEEIVTRPWEINGRTVRFPADFKVRGLEG